MADVAFDNGLDNAVQPLDILGQFETGGIRLRQVNRLQPATDELRAALAHHIKRNDPCAGMPGKPHRDRQISGKMRRSSEKRRHDAAIEAFIAEDRDNAIALSETFHRRAHTFYAGGQQRQAEAFPDAAGDVMFEPAFRRHIEAGGSDLQTAKDGWKQLPIAEVQSKHDDRAFRMHREQVLFPFDRDAVGCINAREDGEFGHNPPFAAPVLACDGDRVEIGTYARQVFHNAPISGAEEGADHSIVKRAELGSETCRKQPKQVVAQPFWQVTQRVMDPVAEETPPSLRSGKEIGEWRRLFVFPDKGLAGDERRVVRFGS
nr:hypothetical protein [Rhizobium sp. Root482]